MCLRSTVYQINEPWTCLKQKVTYFTWESTQQQINTPPCFMCCHYLDVMKPATDSHGSSCSFPCLTHLMHFPSFPLFSILSHPSVTGAELPLASSLVAVGSLDLPRQVFYLCFQLGLLVLKLQRTHGGTQTSGQKNHFPHPKRNLTEVTITFVEQIQSQW